MREDATTNRTRGRSASPVRLPPRPTRLIGREVEVAALQDLLTRDDIRLVTITGPPGVGKTRLAIEVAASLLQFPHGIVFVDLAPVSDPTLVSLAVAKMLGVEEPRAGESVRPIGDRLRYYLAERHLLLVLDNFEQVVDAAEDIAQILASCAQVKVLATSRSPLRLQWEHEFTLEPLALPATDAPAADMQSSPAVRLFAQRAVAAVPTFRLTEENARTVAEICARLDGLPLAIELAAPHTKMLSLSTLLEQLQHRLRLLTGGPRDFPPRHRTLRAAISSSYDLLSPQEQTLFRRLTVFSGGFSLDGAEVICAEDLKLDLPATLSSLGDHQMVRRRPGEGPESRYVILESLREFGLEQLDAGGEARDSRRRHAEFFAQLADTARSQLRGPQQRVWWLKLDEEQDNMWEAIRWAVAEGEAEIAIRLAAVLGGTPWYPHARLQEAAAWTKRALALERVKQKALRAQGLLILGRASLIAEELGQAKQYLEESAALFLEAEDPAGASEALGWLGIGVRDLGRDVERAEALERQAVSLAREGADEARAAVALIGLGWMIMEQGRYVEAKPWFEECLALARRTGVRFSLEAALLGMGAVAAYQGNLAEARSLYEEHLSIMREYHGHRGIATALINLGLTVLWQGDLSRAAMLIEESIHPYREYGERRRVAGALQALGHARELQGKWGEAAAAYQESLTIRSESPQRTGLDGILERTGSLAAQVGHPDLGARLIGKAESVSGDRPRKHMHPQQLAASQKLVHQLIDVLGEERFDEHRRAGRGLSDDQAIEEAHRILAAVIKEHAPGVKPRSSVLSKREEEVAGLVARGLSNRAIAQRLFISERTADTHLQHILNKLGFNSRAQIAAWAVQQGLVPATPNQ